MKPVQQDLQRQGDFACLNSKFVHKEIVQMHDCGTRLGFQG